jgi:putative transposase
MSDALVNGRRMRILNAIDDARREILSVYANFSISGERVVEALSVIVQERGYPRMIRVDNGREFISKGFTKWWHENCVQIKYIQPCKPMQNAYIERFNRLFSDDVLNSFLFESLDQVRMIAETLMDDYNHLHPHKSLDGNQKLSDVCPARTEAE